MPLILFALFMFLCNGMYAQQTVSPNQQVAAVADTIKDRDKASRLLRLLRDGSVVVRLKTNQRSVDAYRKAGKPEIAERIEESRKQQNARLYNAFVNNFLFCKVYFIYAHDTERFLKGEKMVFLNADLQYDSSVIFTDTNFVFCEYGSVEAFSKFTDDANYPSENRSNSQPTRTSTSPATTSGLVFLDRNLQQLSRPFPYVEGVYLDKFDASVRTLSRELERAHGRLVIRKDYRENLKNERKRQRQPWKPFQ